MKKLLAATLLDVLPESILQDPKLKASAQALSAQLQAVTAATREVLHLPRLDELHGAVLDFIAEQLHIDFFEPLYLTEDEKRNLIRDSIAWHRIKGTPAAVEQIAHNAFRDAEVVEWFDYEGGQPYHFKIRSHGFKDTPDGWDTFTRMINVAKNVRSWIDNYELIIDGDEHKLNLFAGNVDMLTGSRTIELARPPTNYRSQAFAGMSNLIHGDKVISIAKPNTAFQALSFVGQALKRVGAIQIGTATEAHGDNSFWRSWTSKFFAGAATFIHGRKVWSLARPKNQKSPTFAGVAALCIGEKSIGVGKPTTNFANRLSTAQILSKVGTVQIDTATEPHDPENRFWRKWQARNFAGVAEFKTGRITYGNSTKRNLGGKIFVHVGQVLIRRGYITIKPDDSEWRDMLEDGDWLGLRFRFPDTSKRIVTLANPRDDIIKDDIRDVGNHAAQNGLVLNASGLSTTGIDLAMLTTRTVRKIF